MIYDPKWEVPAETKPQPSMRGLAEWLETMPPAQRYDYDDCRGRCLLGQYLNAIGLRWNEDSGPGWEVWNRELWQSPMGYLSAETPRTFGAALKRARKELEKSAT